MMVSYAAVLLFAFGKWAFYYELISELMGRRTAAV
jgi:hypothetical protein